VQRVEYRGCTKNFVVFLLRFSGQQSEYFRGKGGVRSVCMELESGGLADGVQEVMKNKGYGI
jgi:hypothetical protein